MQVQLLLTHQGVTSILPYFINALIHCNISLPQALLFLSLLFFARLPDDHLIVLAVFVRPTMPSGARMGSLPADYTPPWPQRLTHSDLLRFPAYENREEGHRSVQ